MYSWVFRKLVCFIGQLRQEIDTSPKLQQKLQHGYMSECTVLDPPAMAECLTCIDFWYDMKGWGFLTVLNWWWINSEVWIWDLERCTLSPSLSRWKILGTRLAIDRELMRYDTTLAPLDRHSFSQSLVAFWVCVCMWLCARLPTLSSSMSPKPYCLVFIFNQSPPFLLFPNSVLLCVFRGRPLPYICSAV